MISGCTDNRPRTEADGGANQAKPHALDLWTAPSREGKGPVRPCLSCGRATLSGRSATGHEASQTTSAKTAAAQHFRGPYLSSSSSSHLSLSQVLDTPLFFRFTVCPPTGAGTSADFALC